MSFVMGLLLLYVIINPITWVWKKVVFCAFASIFLLVSSYIIIQAIYSQRVTGGDFSQIIYDRILLWIPIIVSLVLPLLFYHYHRIERYSRQKLTIIMRPIYDFLYRDAKKEGLVNPLKEKEFDKKVLELTDHVVANE